MDSERQWYEDRLNGLVAAGKLLRWGPTNGVSMIWWEAVFPGWPTSVKATSVPWLSGEVDKALYAIEVREAQARIEPPTVPPALFSFKRLWGLIAGR